MKGNTPASLLKICVPMAFTTRWLHQGESLLGGVAFIRSKTYKAFTLNDVAGLGNRFQILKGLDEE
ncbi:hypothetical protein [Evansella clarkii]|uniref:hypothetical protein n=1 Tax=Evansella clarkii TaxID=79879 RepID=UPI001473C23D|nr:hypothetical protein [Evansella clarkii]